MAAGMITASAAEGTRGIVLVPVRHHVPYFETGAAGAGGPGACLRR